MKTALEDWLLQATRGLAADSSARVRAEIEEHYRSALVSGVTADDAVASLGDPRSANRQYRRVFLTSAEAKHLRRMVGESRAICVRPALRAILIATPFLLANFGAVYYSHSPRIAQIALELGLVLGMWLAVPFLPIYTLRRSRIYRVLKWTVLIAACAALGGASYVTILPSILGYSVYLEFVTYSIRRKLPVEQWPKELYL